MQDNPWLKLCTTIRTIGGLWSFITYRQMKLIHFLKINKLFNSYENIHFAFCAWIVNNIFTKEGCMSYVLGTSPTSNPLMYYLQFPTEDIINKNRIFQSFYLRFGLRVVLNQSSKSVFATI